MCTELHKKIAQKNYTKKLPAESKLAHVLSFTCTLLPRRASTRSILPYLSGQYSRSPIAAFFAQPWGKPESNSGRKRAQVKHPRHAVKNICNYNKTGYNRLTGNATLLNRLFGLRNRLEQGAHGAHGAAEITPIADEVAQICRKVPKNRRKTREVDQDCRKYRAI